ncbi:Hypothetical protein MSYG_1855 [Malassezia sympodialis ATCC 42132]|uniref:Uncharacterized protein n=1 Tax=Malassezia sympodialis (strain ATCC 42132) TaxID=1230383 RepID=A0A1M8A508_MALS4|nr:Hypothetical protein MSYG_1855 [Malassezia sympodialis ATCC 42132]
MHLWQLATWALLSLVLVAAQDSQAAASSGSLSPSASPATSSGGAPSDSGSATPSGPSITATASNPQTGDLAGTAVAPNPNGEGRTGPDDTHFVSGAPAARVPRIVPVLVSLAAVLWGYGLC